MNANTTTERKINLIIYFTKENKPTTQQYSFIPQKTTISTIQRHFKDKVSLSFHNDCIFLNSGSEIKNREVKFSFLPSTYTLTENDNNKTLFVFRKYQESYKPHSLFVRYYFEAAESRLESFVFPLNATNGHLLCFFEQHYKDPSISDKLIFLANQELGHETRLHKLSHRPLPFVNTISIFSRIVTQNFQASQFVPSLPLPIALTRKQVVIRYSVNPLIDSIVWRSEILPTDTTLVSILKRFKTNVGDNQFLNHYGSVLFNGTIYPQSSLSEPIDFSKKQCHEITLYANNLCCLCKKTLAKSGNSFICKSCNHHCSATDCKKSKEYVCFECFESFCRTHIKFCNNSQCSLSYCVYCCRQPELILCGHSFSEYTKGYNVEYKVFHYSEKLTAVGSGNLSNVESIENFLDRIHIPHDCQKYDYLVLNGKDNKKYYFTNKSELYSTSIKELIPYETPNSNLILELQTGKHFCECSECSESSDFGNYCKVCGLEIFPKLPVCTLGSKEDATFNLFLPQFWNPVYSGSVSFDISLKEIITAFLGAVNREIECLKNAHSFTIKLNKTRKTICWNSKEFFQPLFPKSKKIEKQHAYIYINSTNQCRCKPGFLNFHPMKSVCEKCKHTYHSFEPQTESPRCPKCVSQLPNTLVGEHLFRLSKFLLTTPKEHYANYLSRINKSINSRKNIKRRRIDLDILDKESFLGTLGTLLITAELNIIKGQKLLFSCHICNSQGKNNQCSRCKFLYCDKCMNHTKSAPKDKEPECLLCHKHSLISQSYYSNRVITNIEEIQLFCKSAESISQELISFVSAEKNFQ